MEVFRISKIKLSISVLNRAHKVFFNMLVMWFVYLDSIFFTLVIFVFVPQLVLMGEVLNVRINKDHFEEVFIPISSVENYAESS